MWWSYRPYVSVAQRRAKALKEVAKLEKKGRKTAPIKIAGRKISTTFWGNAWCDNLESYSDFANRLPRGRAYVRNGSVVDLQIEAGRVTALVSGSELYKVEVRINPLVAATWTCVKRDCAGQIGSLIELLQGKLSKGVMEIITRKQTGLFPAPAEIKLKCSCPDYADMCKHVAAVLYGVGARLDEQPELLFALRGVDHLDLIAQAGMAPALGKATSGEKTIAAADLGDVFGIDLEPAVPTPMPPVPGKGGKVVAPVPSRRGKQKSKPKPTAAKKPVPAKNVTKRMPAAPEKPRPARSPKRTRQDSNLRPSD